MMKISILATFLLFTNTMVDAKETRCGWLENPTPANLWLTDGDASWGIFFQGGYTKLTQNEIDLAYRALENEEEYVRTNRYYGFSCACLEVETDKKNELITTIHNSKQLKLKQCLEDVKLSKHIPLPYK